MNTLIIRTKTGHFGWHATDTTNHTGKWATHSDERTAAWRAALTVWYGAEPKGGRPFDQAISVYVVNSAPHLWRAIQLDTPTMHAEAIHCLSEHDKAKSRAAKQRTLNLRAILRSPPTAKHRT